MVCFQREAGSNDSDRLRAQEGVHRDYWLQEAASDQVGGVERRPRRNRCKKALAINAPAAGAVYNSPASR